jgi:L-alanine-DL-glutamate epimerase-like enolase superfamily enzyme
MKINRISVWQLDLPLHKPYWLSGGRLKFEQLDSTILRIDTDEGVSGWGEGCPWGVTYLPAFGKGIRAGIDEIAALLIGKDPRQLDAINRIMDLALPGHPYVKSAIDMACWDIAAKSANLPLCELLGAREPAPVPIASSVSTGSPQEMLDEVQRFRDQGYRVHSCKVGADVTMDIERINLLAANERAGEIMFYDANRAWLPREAITVLNSIAGVSSWFEQPCETLDEIAQVRRQTSCPIGVDEGLHTMEDLIRIQRDGIAELVNIKYQDQSCGRPDQGPPYARFLSCHRHHDADHGYRRYRACRHGCRPFRADDTGPFLSWGLVLPGYGQRRSGAGTGCT